MSYTVDEVSELLDVPRPTLYRYLKEYSIPHVRRSGKIYVPDESFNRIKEVRELHKEGLGTELVRRRLQGERSDLDGVLVQQLERISGTLENLQVHLKPANGESFAQTLQAISVQQNVLISAVFDLTEMLEGLVGTKGRSRKAWPLEAPDAEMQRQETFFEEEPDGHYEKAEKGAAVHESHIESIPESMVLSTTPGRRRKFGYFARRRQRSALVVLLIILTSTALTAAVAQDSKKSSEEVPQEKVSASSQEATTSIRPQEAKVGNHDAVPLYSPAHDEERLAAYDEEGNEELVPEAMPEPVLQENPWLPPTPDGEALP